MTFSAELSAADLAQAASRLSALVDTRLSVPVLANVLLRIADGRLHCAATNCDQSLIISIPAAGEGAATLSAARLAAASARLDTDKPVTLKGEGTQVTIRQGRASWKLPTIPVEEFPAVLTEAVDGAEWQVEASPLIARLEEVQGAASPGGKAGRPWLEGVYFDLDTDRPALAATEGYSRLAIADIDDLAPPRMPGFVLPLQAIRPIADLARLSARLTARLHKDVVSFEAVGENRAERVRTRLIDGQFPPYRRIIPASGGIRIACDADRLTRAIARTAVVEGDVIEAGRGKKRRNIVRLDISESEVVFTARSQAGEEAIDACECVRLAGDDGAVVINTNHLLWAAESFVAADSIEIAATPPGPGQEGSPIVLTRAADAETRRSLRLIMPMRG